MLDRLSANVLVKSVIGVLGLMLLVSLALRLAESWSVLASSERTLAVAEVSREAFKAMVNQRTDRSTTARTWNATGTILPETADYLQKLRAAEMPALHATIAGLERIPIAGQAALLADLRQQTQALEQLQAEHLKGVMQPKETRRPGLAEAYVAQGLALQGMLEKISAGLVALVKTDDAFVGQLMQAKQLAWMVRNTAGDASLLISNGLAAGKLPPAARWTFTGHATASEALWTAMEDTLHALPLPNSFGDTVARAKSVLFAPDYLAMRERLLEALINGGKPEMVADAWTPYTVPKLGVTEDVADAALAAAATHAAELHAVAWTRLLVEVALMLMAGGLSVVCLITVGRRLIQPLHALRDAMLKLAAGDLSVAAPFIERRDEIGALSGAFEVFQKQAAAKAAIEAEQARSQAENAERQAAVARLIRDFETQFGTALEGLGAASEQMDRSSVDMETIAGQSNDQARAAAMAADETSSNVAGIAAATEELSASISEISRQVSHATAVTGRAVEETRQTDDTVRGLAETAGRIGDVVDLISDIAGRTNLLALNATIEAARAGDAGKGFAVVASEVKSLANQTAKATQEIAAQIAAVREVTDSTVAAIRQIGTTIGEVSAVATSIAAAVEQQGASTQEIARNTQQAARLTQEMSHTVMRVTQGADATGATAEVVKSAAGELGTQAAHLRAQVQAFLSQIRAA